MSDDEYLTIADDYARATKAVEAATRRRYPVGRECRHRRAGWRVRVKGYCGEPDWVHVETVDEPDWPRMPECLSAFRAAELLPLGDATDPAAK